MGHHVFHVLIVLNDTWNQTVYCKVCRLLNLQIKVSCANFLHAEISEDCSNSQFWPRVLLQAADE